MFVFTVACSSLSNLFPTPGLVIEDAPSGIRSGHAAGAKTLAVCTSHSKEQIEESGCNPDYIVKDLARFVLLRQCLAAYFKYTLQHIGNLGWHSA